MALRDWEVGLHAWEDVAGRDAVEGPPSDSEEEWNPDACSMAESQTHLFDLLVELKLTGKLSAVQCGVLAYWSCKAGRTER